MIFNTSTIIGSMLTEKLANECGGAKCRVLIYRGTQPSISSYITDWGTKYKYPGATFVNSPSYASYTGTELLAAYGGDGSNGLKPVVLINGANAVTLDSSKSVPDKTYARDGIATWAVVFFASNFDFYGNMAVDAIKDTAFMLVPVSAPGDNGVVRLGSTTITSALPDIGDVYLSFAIPGGVS